MTIYYTISRKGDITKTRLFIYIENFTIKNSKFSDKNSDMFHISAHNIDCGYSLGPPRRGGSTSIHNPCFCAEIKKMYPPRKSQFHYITVGFKGVKIYSYMYVFVMETKLQFFTD